MAVKSATKRALVNMGVSEDVAAALATNRNIKRVKEMTCDELNTICEKLSQNGEEVFAILHREHLCLYCDKITEKQDVCLECGASWPMIEDVNHAVCWFNARKYTTVGTPEKPILIEFEGIKDGQETFVPKKDDRKDEEITEFFQGGSVFTEIRNNLLELTKLKGKDLDDEMIQSVEDMSEFTGVDWVKESLKIGKLTEEEEVKELEEIEKLGEDLRGKPRGKRGDKSSARKGLRMRRARLQRKAAAKAKQEAPIPISFEINRKTAEDLAWRYSLKGVDDNGDEISEKIHEVLLEKMENNPALSKYACTSDEMKQLIDKFEQRGILTEDNFFDYLGSNDSIDPDGDEAKLISLLHLFVENPLLGAEVEGDYSKLVEEGQLNNETTKIITEALQNWDVEIQADDGETKAEWTKEKSDTSGDIRERFGL